MRILLFALIACGSPAQPKPTLANTPTAATAPTAHPTMVGRWRIVGCETSPQDPADCGRGKITFTADHIVVDVPAAEYKNHTYSILESAHDRLVLYVDGQQSVVTIDVNGVAHWRAPGMGGRVGELTFERE